MTLRIFFFLFFATFNAINGISFDKRQYVDRSGTGNGFQENQFSGSELGNSGNVPPASLGFPESNRGLFSSTNNVANLDNGGRGFTGSASGFGGGAGTIDTNRNGKGSYSNNNGMNNNFSGGRGSFNSNGKDGASPFSANGNGGSGGFDGGQSPFPAGIGNNNGGSGSGTGSPFSNAGNGGGFGKGPFNTAGNGGGSSPSGLNGGPGPFSAGNGVDGGMSSGGGAGSFSNNGNGGGMGKGPFNTAGNGGGSGLNGGSGPFSTGSGNSGGASSGSGSAGPFSNTGSGGGIGKGPFNTAGNAEGSGPFNANGGKMTSPFNTASNAGSNQSPFKTTDSNLDGKNPFDASKFQGVDFGSMGGAMATNNAVGNPMASSSLAQSSVGPGGLAGSAFTTDIGTDAGPGGLAGGSFYAGTDSSRPGGFGGGSFQTDNSHEALFVNTDTSLGERQPSRFDTAKYEQMLSQMYNPKNYETQLVDKPFGSHEYAGAPQVSNTGSYGSSYSTGVNGQASHSSAGSLSGGKQTDEPGPFDTRPFKHVQGPFSSHTGNQYKGSNYQVDAASSLGGHNFAAVGYSGGSYGVDSSGYSSGSAQYNAGNAAAYVSGNNAAGGSSTGYETPFDRHVDNYNDLISNPFNSNMNSNPNQYSEGSYGSMFKSNNNYGGMSEANPGGNPFRQGGNKAGMSMAFNNKGYNG